MFCLGLTREKPLIHLIRFISNKKSHYEVLNVPRNCSDKQIKDAFIKLSKQLHPDRNKNGNTHDEFVRVMEAYTVLSKRHSRAQYDDTTTIYSDRPHTAWTHVHHEYPRARPNYNQYDDEKVRYREFYSSYDYTNSDEARQNLKKNHTHLVLLCVAFAIGGFAVQMWVILSSAKRRQVRLDSVSKEAGQHLARVREAALLNGNQLQTQLIMDRVREGASPAASTAALADAVTHK